MFWWHVNLFECLYAGNPEESWNWLFFPVIKLRVIYSTSLNRQKPKMPEAFVKLPKRWTWTVLPQGSSTLVAQESLKRWLDRDETLSCVPPIPPPHMEVWIMLYCLANNDFPSNEHKKKFFFKGMKLGRKWTFNRPLVLIFCFSKLLKMSL